ncbi:DNA-directed RNA polymerase subunit K [archaeon]|nr:DNA-directed RNA polymerase subunit K [archaeon]
MAAKKSAKKSEDHFNADDFSKYEKARMVGSRALQLSMGAPFLLKMDQKALAVLQYNPVRIALHEFQEGVLPITVRRPVPGQ